MKRNVTNKPCGCGIGEDDVGVTCLNYPNCPGPFPPPMPERQTAGTRPTPKPQGDVTKLPKWAQDHLRILDMRLREAYEELEIHGDVTQSNTTFRRPSRLESEFIPPDSTVSFLLPAPEGFRPCAVRVRVSERGVEVNADRSLSVVLGATNSFTIQEFK